MRNPGWAGKTGAKYGSAAISKDPKAALTTIPDVMSFYHTGKWWYLENPV